VISPEWPAIYLNDRPDRTIINATAAIAAVGRCEIGFGEEKPSETIIKDRDRRDE
jgi:hypothetical protein